MSTTKTMNMNKTEHPKKISLQRLLRGKVLARTLLVLLCCFAGTALFAQNTVRGKVTSNTGDPVPGASVSVKGTSTGTNTGMDGSFTIPAAKGAILVVSSVTYATQEITVGDESTINIQLAPSATDLGEVVVVGYGTQRKEAVTGSVASIGGERMREVPSPNVSQALQG